MCLSYAIRTGQDDTWAGTTKDERHADAGPPPARTVGAAARRAGQSMEFAGAAGEALSDDEGSSAPAARQAGGTWRQRQPWPPRSEAAVTLTQAKITIATAPARRRVALVTSIAAARDPRPGVGIADGGSGWQFRQQRCARFQPFPRYNAAFEFRKCLSQFRICAHSGFNTWSGQWLAAAVSRPTWHPTAWSWNRASWHRRPACWSAWPPLAT